MRKTVKGLTKCRLLSTEYTDCCLSTYCLVLCCRSSCSCCKSCNINSRSSSNSSSIHFYYNFACLKHRIALSVLSMVIKNRSLSFLLSWNSPSSFPIPTVLDIMEHLPPCFLISFSSGEALLKISLYLYAVVP